ncbi:MAG: hypothetical protein NTY77_11760 [Elusimicrobia bacterium]|nr:hypothetical protein [Elusimicrobiota bacterium]
MNRIDGAIYFVAINAGLSGILCLALSLASDHLRFVTIHGLVGIMFGIVWALVGGTAAGSIYSLLFVVYYMGESVPRPIYWRLIWATGPFVVLSLVISTEPPGHLILFLQLMAAMLPSLLFPGALRSLLGGLLSGFAFLFICGHMLRLNMGSDHFFPICIVVVAAEVAFARFLIGRVRAEVATQ